MKKIYKNRILLCSYEKTNNSNLLLPFQYSIVDYDSRKKSSILEFKRLSLVNLRNLEYNILKSFKDKTIRDIDFSDLSSCFKYSNDILMSLFKTFSYLMYRHIFHKLYIEKKFFLSISNVYSTPDCKKNVNILD